MRPLYWIALIVLFFGLDTAVFEGEGTRVLVQSAYKFGTDVRYELGSVVRQFSG